MTNPTDPKPQEALAAPLEPRCPKCGELMQHDFWRTSIDSKSAVKVRCFGKDESYHEFTIRRFGDFAQFFPAQPPSAMTAMALAEKIVLDVFPSMDRECAVRYIEQTAKILRGHKPAEPHTLTREQDITKQWYESMKAADPHKFEEYEEGGEIFGAYPFEDFRNCPMVTHGLAAFALSLSLPSTRPSGDGWIKRSERLPEFSGTKIVTFASGTVSTTHWNHAAKIWGNALNQKSLNVDYWRELPAPPTEEKGPSGEGS